MKNTLVKDDLSFHYGDYHFRLPIRSARIAVIGDSGVGKTFLINLLNKISGDSVTNPELGCLRKQLLFINHKTDRAVVLFLLSSSKGKIIFIDNADIVLKDEETLTALDQSENQIILFGRDTDRYHISMKHIAVLQRDGTNFWLRYMER